MTAESYAQPDARRAEKYYAVLDRCYQQYRRMIETDCAGREVLEYGCGRGSHAYELARRGAQVTGIDIAPVAIKAAANRAYERDLDIRFVEMNAEELEFGPASFDLICGASILHHLDRHVATAQLARCLRPGGKVVFAEPLGHNPLINAYRWFTPHPRSPHQYPLRMIDFDIFRQHFAVVEVDYFALTALAAYPVRRRREFRAVLDRLDRLDQRLFDRTPWVRKFSWFCVVVMRGPLPGSG
jgi:SAM-dependent methyltransferase